jgi:hypothetical protein
MMYTLQATTSEVASAIGIEALDDEDAMYQAIDQVMGRAMSSETWATGHIVLSDPTGRVIKEMLAKR